MSKPLPLITKHTELESPRVFGLKSHGQRRTTDGAENHRWGRPDQRHSRFVTAMDGPSTVSKVKSEEKQKHQYSTLSDMFEMIKFHSLTSILYNNAFVYLVNIKVCLLRCGVVIVCCFLKGVGGGGREKTAGLCVLLTSRILKQLLALK